jgi:hypothetical protein
MRRGAGRRAIDKRLRRWGMFSRTCPTVRYGCKGSEGLLLQRKEER